MIKDNLLKLEIFYKEFNFENIQEKPAYSVKQCDAYIVVYNPMIAFVM